MNLQCRPHFLHKSCRALELQHVRILDENCPFQLSGSLRMLAPSHGALFGSVRTLDRTDTSSEVLSGSVNTIYMYQTDPNSGVTSVFVRAVDQTDPSC